MSFLGAVVGNAKGVAATFRQDFTKGETLDPRITFSRNSPATRYNHRGEMVQVQPNEPVFDYDPATPITGTRTNYIRNSTMQGATVGTGSTALPTDWGLLNNSGLLISVVERGIDEGLDYIDIRLSGTTVASGVAQIVIYHTTNYTTVTPGQVWTASAYYRMRAGDMTAFTSRLRIAERNDSGVYLRETSLSLSDTTNLLTRRGISRTIPSDVARLGMDTTFSFNNNQVVDTTLRIAAPQLEQAAAATPFIPTTNAPVTVGLTVDVKRTNHIRNSTAQGAVVGTVGAGGVLPANWSIAAGTGLAREIVGVGTENGFAYLDVRLSGTPSITYVDLYFEGASAISALAGQSWTHSVYLKLVAGSFANITTTRVIMSENGTAGAYIRGTASTPFSSVGNTLTRYAATDILTGSGTLFVRPYVSLGLTSGQPIDITLRIAAPQLEYSFNATAFIPTTTAAVTVTEVEPVLRMPLGLRIWEKRTNLIPNSESMPWPGSFGMSFTSTALKLDGRGTAKLMQRVNTTQNYINVGNIAKATQPLTYSFSCLVKTNDANFFSVRLQGQYPARADVIFNFNTKTFTYVGHGGFAFTQIPTFRALLNDTYQISFSITTDSYMYISPYMSCNNAGVNIDSTDTSSNCSVYVQNLQVEEGDTASPYIPTNGAAFTRESDYPRVSGTNFSNFSNPSEGTLIVEYMCSNVTNIAKMAVISGGTGGISFETGFAAPGQHRMRVSDGGTDQCALTPILSAAVNTIYRLGGSWKTNEFRASANGGALSIKDSGTVPVGNNAIYFGCGGPTTGHLNGYLRRFTYYPKALPNQVQNLSSLT